MQSRAADDLTSADQVHLAARLYYVDNLPQAQVARLCKVSQAKVSRLLSAARQRGIVRITVADFQPRARGLEKRLRAALGLDAIVIKTADGLEPDDLRRTLAHFAGPIVSRAVAGAKTLAVSGGRTLREVVAQLGPEAPSPTEPSPTNAKGSQPARQSLTVVQAMGHVDSSVLPVDASELARAVADRFGATLLTLNVPAIVPDRKTRDTLMELQQVQAVFRRLEAAKAALVGVGTLENSVFVERGVLTKQELARLKEAGAVGEICGRFFDARGRECDSPLRNRVIGIGLEVLKRLPNVVAVVAGKDRSAALAAAARGGLIKSLVIDSGGASALLE